MFIKVVDLISPAEAREIRNAIADLPWQEGKARTPELTGTIKQNLELLPTRDGETVKTLSKRLTDAVLTHPEIAPALLPKQATNFKFNNYKDTGTYNRHTDAPYMGPVRTDFSCTIFLTEPDEYEGGELNIETPAHELISFKGHAGQAVVYECGQPHWVSPVTDGERISAIGWIQSVLSDPRRREVAVDIRRVCRQIEDHMNNQDPENHPSQEELRTWFVDLGKVHGMLYREWI